MPLRSWSQENNLDCYKRIRWCLGRGRNGAIAYAKFPYSGISCVGMPSQSRARGNVHSGRNGCAGKQATTCLNGLAVPWVRAA